MKGLSFDSVILWAASLGANDGDYVRIQDVATTDRFLYLSTTIVSDGLYKRSTVARVSLRNLWDGIKNPAVQFKRSETMGGGYYGFARAARIRCTSFDEEHDDHARFQLALRHEPHRGLDRTIARWYPEFSNSPLRDGENWLANDNRTAQRLKLGNEVGYLFDSNKGGTRRHPFIRISRFRTTNLSLIREHNLTNNNHAWAFPSVTVG